VGRCHLLHAYFGRERTRGGEEMLARHSGDADKPRILGTFNEPINDWLVVLHVHVLHRPRRQVSAQSLAESGLDPLARTCRFMLTEEAHHMFVGETGVGRV